MKPRKEDAAALAELAARVLENKAKNQKGKAIAAAAVGAALRKSVKPAVKRVVQPTPTETNMRPLPKWMGVLGALGAIVGALNTADVLAVLPQAVGSVLATVGPIITLLAHSLTGKGGKA